MSNKSKISVIGLGAMGTALAKTFLKNGYETTVWNRTIEKAKPITDDNLIIASNITEAILISDVIVICVLNYAVLNEIFQNNSNGLSGKTIINLTNGTPKQAEDTAKWFSKFGAKYIDGGIMAIPPTIGTPHAYILYSGDETAFNQNKELLNVLGVVQFIGTEYGLASLYDLSLLTAMYGMFGGYLHAVCLAGSANIKAIEFTPVIINWLTAMMNALPHLAQQIDAKDYSLGGVISNVALNVHGIDNIINASEYQKVSTEFILPWQSLLHKAVENGYSANDLSAIVDLLRK